MSAPPPHSKTFSTPSRPRNAVLSGAPAAQAAHSIASSIPRRRSNAATMSSSQPRCRLSSDPTFEIGSKRRPGRITPACTSARRSSVRLITLLPVESTDSRCFLSSGSCPAVRFIASASTTRCCSVHRAVMRCNALPISSRLASGCTACLSAVSRRRKSCSSACAAVGRWTEIVDSNERTKALGASLMDTQASRGSNVYQPARMFLRVNCCVSASNGQRPLSSK
mmetsp:Transcript_12230/g.21257  ORF Transcript_12230/g.21257 Transcript_12230/m.21257 type:complete len:224 (+) Transcript_12230:281-952(+)